jgi:short-subunit dehydrogenase
MTQHVLITGGSQGVGKATALLFAKNGWDVTIAARGCDRLNAVAEQIRILGQRALAIGKIAEAVQKAVNRRQNEVVVGRPATVATAMNRLFPALTQWALTQGTRG